MFKTKHGMFGTKTHNSWRAMRQRCLYKSKKDKKYYFDKGITFDPKWETFEGFYEDMGDRPEKCTLDRIDNSEGYCKENCRWASFKVQSDNRKGWSKIGEKYIVQYKYGYRVKITGVVRKRVKTLEEAIRIRDEHLHIQLNRNYALQEKNYGKT